MSAGGAMLGGRLSLKPASLVMRKIPRGLARTEMDGAVVRPVFSREELINAESEVGRKVFGPVPDDVQREFFMQSKNVWIWHENGVTLRYEVRPEGVYKKVEGSQKNYVALTEVELANFVAAVRAYLQLVKAEIY